MRLTKRIVSAAAAAAVVAAALAVPAVFGQAGGSPGMTFEVNHDFEVLMDGSPVTGATCYTSRDQAGVIVLGAELGGAVFTRLADRKVVSVNPLGLRIRGDTLQVDDASVFGAPVTGWNLDGSAAVFSLGGKSFRIQPRPIVVGRVTPQEVVAKTPSYRHMMSLYEPDREAISYLKGFGQQVSIEVYFGSWCHVCKQYLPQFLRTVNDCANPNLQVTLFGLPRDFSRDDERWRDKKIGGIPCVIVYKDGQEVGRIEGAPAKSYEKDLGGLLRLATARKG